MTDLIYISPSVLPSKSANSIHVMRQCYALAKISGSITLIAATKHGKEANVEKILEYYDIKKLNNFEIKLVRSPTSIGINLLIAVRAAFYILGQKHKRGSKVLSRNLYASFLLSLINFNHVYETHGVELGIKSVMQKYIMKNNKNITISNALRILLCEKYNVSEESTKVLHDAADAAPLLSLRSQGVNQRAIKKVGYFGHLYEGRGIEVIIDLAKRNDTVNFLVVGGNQSDVEKYRRNNQLQNLEYLGFLKYAEARILMAQMDILLMPYQKSVSIGVKGSDTSKWMSPLKMFEYMSSKVPIISSDLPVLKEVLRDGTNSLLVEPNNIASWDAALNRLIDDDQLSSLLAKNAYDDFQRKFTWYSRGREICKLLM